MNKKLLLQSIVSCVTIIVLLISTSHNSMMSMNAMIAHTIPYAMIVLISVLVISFVFEITEDERENTHIMKADRYALFAVILVLGTGIFLDQLSEIFNPWMVGALCTILFVKMVSRLVLYYKN